MRVRQSRLATDSCQRRPGDRRSPSLQIRGPATAVKKSTNPMPDTWDIRKLAGFRDQLGYKVAVFLRFETGTTALRYEPQFVRRGRVANEGHLEQLSIRLYKHQCPLVSWVRPAIEMGKN